MILKRSDEKQYANQWRMICGKIEEETAWEAGLIEFKEETSIVPELYWTNTHYFYNHKSNEIECIPAFVAQFPKKV